MLPSSKPARKTTAKLRAEKNATTIANEEELPLVLILGWLAVHWGLWLVGLVGWCALQGGRAFHSCGRCSRWVGGHDFVFLPVLEMRFVGFISALPPSTVLYFNSPSGLRFAIYRSRFGNFCGWLSVIHFQLVAIALFGV